MSPERVREGGNLWHGGDEPVDGDVGVLGEPAFGVEPGLGVVRFAGSCFPQILAHEEWHFVGDILGPEPGIPEWDVV